MSSDKSLAARIYALLSRDPKFRRLVGDHTIVCLADDTLGTVAVSAARTYGPDTAVTCAVYYPGDQEFQFMTLMPGDVRGVDRRGYLAADAAMSEVMDAVYRGTARVSGRPVSTAALEASLVA